MEINDYIDGTTVLFYINTESGWIPVGCLTDNPFSVSTDRLETTVRGSGGFKSYIPTIHDYSLSLSGILSKNEGVVSYNDLSTLQRTRVIFEWMISSTDNHIGESGTAFITELSLGSSAHAWVSFSCTLSPASGGVSGILVWSQNGLNVVSQNGENMIQIK